MTLLQKQNDNSFIPQLQMWIKSDVLNNIYDATHVNGTRKNKLNKMSNKVVLIVEINL